MTLKKINTIDPERDVLRARFTVWMDTTLARASARYREQMKDELEEESKMISLESFSPDFFADPCDHYANIMTGRDFDFEEERLANAFSELSLMRKEVLRLMFVEGLNSREIASVLHCSEAFVRVQKQRALGKLREKLIKKDEGAHEK